MEREKTGKANLSWKHFFKDFVSIANNYSLLLLNLGGRFVCHFSNSLKLRIFSIGVKHLLDFLAIST